MTLYSLFPKRFSFSGGDNSGLRHCCISWLAICSFCTPWLFYLQTSLSPLLGYLLIIPSFMGSIDKLFQFVVTFYLGIEFVLMCQSRLCSTLVHFSDTMTLLCIIGVHGELHLLSQDTLESLKTFFRAFNGQNICNLQPQ